MRWYFNLCWRCYILLIQGLGYLDHLQHLSHSRLRERQLLTNLIPLLTEFCYKLYDIVKRISKDTLLYQYKTPRIQCLSTLIHYLILITSLFFRCTFPPVLSTSCNSLEFIDFKDYFSQKGSTLGERICVSGSQS